MPKTITLVYLARLVDGFPSFEAFAEGYRRYPSGCDHDLVILTKGFSKPGEIAAISAVFAGVPHRVIEVDDDIGVDIHAYWHVVRQLNSEFLCFFNTHTRPNTVSWLQKLSENISKPGIGLVGATGSYESLFNSFKLISLVNYAVTAPCAFNRDLAKRFRWLLVTACPHTITALSSFRRRVRRAAGDFLFRRITLDRVRDSFPGVWAQAMGCNGNSLREFRDFPKFPNPHVRSTAFMIRRNDFLSIPFNPQEKTKIAACLFESGPDGMSSTLVRKGLDVLVVGADGTGYTMDQWPGCGAFRSGDQSNLLATDNQTRLFDQMTEGDRYTHDCMTWGGYAPDDPSQNLLGIPFSSHLSVRDRMEHLRPIPAAVKERLISIAIPTHNRLPLVLDAIKTITHQNYSNWEIVVFDNASNEPVGDAIRALDDARIRCERSDQFLPVTESWNNAINMAMGEYVTLIGDDDGLAPGFFQRINYLANHFGDPEVIFSSLLQFMHPGVVPGARPGYVASLQMADFFEDRDYPFILDPDVIKKSVNNSLAMRRSFMFNMPAFAVRRSLIDKMRINGSVLLSPFPDYYFANIALSLADKVVAEPVPIAFQGVSKVSFGFTLMNSRTDDGFKVLNHDVISDKLYEEVSGQLLPGSRYSSEYIVTMAYVARTLGDPSRKPDFAHYRRVQIWDYLVSQPSILRWVWSEKGSHIFEKLTTSEKSWALKVNAIYKLAQRFPRLFDRTAHSIAKGASAYEWKATQIIYRVGDYVTLFDVFRDLQDGSFWRSESWGMKK